MIPAMLVLKDFHYGPSQYQCLNCEKIFELGITKHEFLFCPCCGIHFIRIIDARLERFKRRSSRRMLSNKPAYKTSRWVIQIQDLQGNWHVLGKRIDSGEIEVDGKRGRSLTIDRIHIHREWGTTWAGAHGAIFASIKTGDKLPLP